MRADGCPDGVISIGIHENASASRNGTNSVILTFVERPVNDKITWMHKEFTVQIRKHLHYLQLANKINVLISFVLHSLWQCISHIPHKSSFCKSSSLHYCYWEADLNCAEPGWAFQGKTCHWLENGSEWEHAQEPSNQEMVVRLGAVWGCILQMASMAPKTRNSN